MKRLLTAFIAAALLIGIAPTANAAETRVGWGRISLPVSVSEPTQVRVALTDGTRLGRAECFTYGCTPVRVKRIRNLGADTPVVLTRANGRTWRGVANKTFVARPPRGGQTIEFAGIEVREP